MFTHRISKGSRYNQIYVPAGNESQFEVGDLVEVRLLEKKNRLYVHKASLTDFKRKLISEIFRFLAKNSDIEQIFVFGSFLYGKIGYNDIDIIIMGKDDSEEFDNKITDNLTEEFNLKFHVISVKEEGFLKELKTSPLMRSMMSHFVSNEKFSVPRERELDKNHILYLLMGPEDILKTDFEKGRIYYDQIRKLDIIERFLHNDEEDMLEINKNIENELGTKMLERLKKDEFIGKKDIDFLREIINKRLNKIKKEVKWERKKK